MKQVGVVFIIIALMLLYLLFTGKAVNVFNAIKDFNTNPSAEQTQAYKAFGVLVLITLLVAGIPKVGPFMVVLLAGFLVVMVSHELTNTSTK